MYIKSMLFVGILGVLFSGYLSAVKFFTSTCAFNEPCPYFLGYPACWYGFGLFLIIFITAVLGIWEKISKQKMAEVLSIVSGLGIIFAGYFTIPEIKIMLSGAETSYSLGLPTCAYGLIFYILIFIFSVTQLRRKEIGAN